MAYKIKIGSKVKIKGTDCIGKVQKIRDKELKKYGVEPVYEIKCESGKKKGKEVQEVKKYLEVVK